MNPTSLIHKASFLAAWLWYGPSYPLLIPARIPKTLIFSGFKPNKYKMWTTQLHALQRNRKCPYQLRLEIFSPGFFLISSTTNQKLTWKKEIKYCNHIFSNRKCDFLRRCKIKKRPVVGVNFEVDVLRQSIGLKYVVFLFLFPVVQLWIA